MAVGGMAAVLAVVGSLTALVEAASLAFLFTFTVVCALAFRERAGIRAIPAFGMVAGDGA